MKVSGTRAFAAPRAVVWEVLNDPARMAKTMPGVESFEIADERHWSAKVKIPLGLGGLAMSINFEKTDERELEFAQLSAKGTGVGALMSMITQFRLSDASGGGTDMAWEADVRIAGPVGAMGQRVLQPIVNHQVGNVLKALDVQVQEAAAGAGGAAGREEARGAQTPPHPGSEGGGTAGAPREVTTDVNPKTDPEVKDYGPPAEPTPEADPAEVEGSSGAEEGLNPWAPESYSSDPQGPTITPQDRPE